MVDISEISRQLNSRAEDVAKMLLPGGKREGSEWRAGDTSGDRGRSLGVHLSGAKVGVWRDFSSDKGGADLLDLWAVVKGISLREALREAKQYLGIVEPSFVGPRKKEYRTPEKPQCKKPLIDSPVGEYLAGRGLMPETIAAYKIGEGVGPHGPEIVFPYLRDSELTNVKYLALERDAKGKKQTRFESGCMLGLFGWQAVPDSAREVLICEGELDAPSWYQFGIPALSVPNGAKSFTWLENELDSLDRFETIYLSWDNDGDGRAGVAEAVDRLGRHRCRVVELPFKDANECLQKGISAEQMHSFVASSVSHDPAELKRASVYVEEVIDEFYPPNGIQPGFAPPWKKLDGLLRFRPGEFSIWSGFSGTGKTTMLNQIILAGMEQGERACIASLEIKPRKLLKRMTRQATAERLPHVDSIREAHIWYDGKLWIFDLVGSAKVERLFEVFEYARRRYGITQFVIDSLMRCGMAEDDYNGQKRVADMCAEFSTSHNVGTHLVAHSRKKESDSHEGSRLDVKGSGAITDLAHNVYVVWRNKEKEKAIEAAQLLSVEPSKEVLDKPDAMLICDKSRDGEWEGRAGLWYDLESYQYLESRQAFRHVYAILPDYEVIA